MRELGYAESKFLGGDLEHTHLVKGLDFALLKKVRQDLREKDGGGAPGGGLSEEPRFRSELGRAVHRAATRDRSPDRRVARAKLEPGRTVYRYALRGDADAEGAAPPTTVLLPAESRGRDLADLVDDGPLLKRVGKVLGYLQVGAAPDANVKKMRRKKKVLEKLQDLKRSALPPLPPGGSEAGGGGGRTGGGGRASGGGDEEEEDDIFADDDPLPEDRAALPNPHAPGPSGPGGRSYFNRTGGGGAEEADFSVYSKAAGGNPAAPRDGRVGAATAAAADKKDEEAFAEYIAGAEDAGPAERRAGTGATEGEGRDVGMGLKLHDEDDLYPGGGYAALDGGYGDSDDEGRPRKGKLGEDGEDGEKKSRRQKALEKEKSRDRKLDSQLNRIKRKFEKDGRDHGAAFGKEASPEKRPKARKSPKPEGERAAGPAPRGRVKRLKL